MRKEIIILAVTHTYDGYCVAGMSRDGEWVRPIPDHGRSRFWTKNELTLKPSGGFTVAGDVWEIEGQTPVQYQHPNHTEDFKVSAIKYVRSLHNDELIRFLSANVEGKPAFEDTMDARGRSLCLVEADSLTPFLNSENKAKMRLKSNHLDLTNRRTNGGEYPITDCKWAALVKNSVSLPQFEKIYFCMGLATPTPYDGVEYPMVIGIHTIPDVKPLHTYPF